MSESYVPYVYTLTEIIGKGAGSDRTTEILTFEMTRRAFFGALAGLGAGVFLGAVFTPLLGIWSLVLLPAGIAGGMWAATFRSGKGMRLRPYEKLVVKKHALTGRVLYCTKPFNPFLAHPLNLVEARYTTPSVVLNQRQWKQI